MLVLTINICTDRKLEVIDYIVDCLFEIDEMSIYFLFVKLYCIFYSIYALLLVWEKIDYLVAGVGVVFGVYVRGGVEFGEWWWWEGFL